MVIVIVVLVVVGLVVVVMVMVVVVVHTVYRDTLFWGETATIDGIPPLRLLVLHTVHVVPFTGGRNLLPI